jgi:Concanavalin A-like lectin/glucanases superfamily
MSSGTDKGADTIASKWTGAFTGYSFATYGQQVGGYVGGATGVVRGMFALNAWSHVAAVFSREGVQIYINGEPQTPTPVPPALTIPSNLEPLTIGNLNPAILGASPPATHGFHGDIDVVRIYGRSRTPEEICRDAYRVWSGTCRDRTQ